MPYTPELVEELNTLVRFPHDTSQQGIKVHKDAAPALISAAKRLYAKGLITQMDGGFLTAEGREVVGHAHALLAALASGKPPKSLT